MNMLTPPGSDDDRGSNPSPNPSLEDAIAVRFGRRDFLLGALAASMATSTSGSAVQAADASTFGFTEIEAKVSESHAVSPGYDVQILLSWGDALFPDMPPFDPLAQSAADQARRFGYNNDYVGYLPIAGSSRHGLLVVNHEYTNEELMFPGMPEQSSKGDFAETTRRIAGIEMAAHGGAVVEIRHEASGWAPVLGSRYTRRITAETPMELTGPAAGSPRLATGADPAGRHVLGMINNCSGGVTPWGTWLSGEENFHYYFDGRPPADHGEIANHSRYGLGRALYGWHRHHERFAIPREPNEPNRFGWVVEIDPFDPTSTPKKRTALGRMKHEGAAGALTTDGRYAVFLGDDERFEYVYRFVTEQKVDLTNPAANRDILDRGILSVARYDSDGTGRWLPLVHGEGPITQVNGFGSQADVLIETRRAADLLGATKMDRPEDIEANPASGRVYVMLTNNTRRRAEEVNAANPRPNNAFGHVVEMIPDGSDHGASTFRWEILLKCGDPSIAEIGATFSAETTREGWFGMPDNCAFDSRGRLWISTDGNDARRTGRNDGLWAVETDGARRGTSRHFFRAPDGAELCGPFFTPDDETLFLAVQHPGEADDRKSATFDKPTTRWPDFRDGMPPRPSVVVITKQGGGRIG